MPFNNDSFSFLQNVFSKTPFVESNEFGEGPPPPETCFLITKAGDFVVTQGGDSVLAHCPPQKNRN